MRHFRIITLFVVPALTFATAACGVGSYDPAAEVETSADELRFARMRPIQAPMHGYACRFHFPELQDLSSGRLVADAEIYSQPGCRGSFIGRRRVAEQLAPGFIKIANRYPQLTQVHGVGAVVEVPPDAIMECDGDLGYRPARGELFDIWGGEWSCTDIGDNGMLSCGEDLGGLEINLCSDGVGAPDDGYDCGWKWWELGKCVTLSIGSELVHVPGLSEAIAAIRSGAYTTLATILASNLAAAILENLGVIPMIDSCACFASETVLGCGLNLSETLDYTRDLAQQQADTPCSYGH